MNKIISIIFCSAIISVSLVACNSKPPTNSPISEAIDESTVVAIDISTQPANDDYTRHYSDPAKIEEICSYIRGLSWHDLKNEDPNKEDGTEYIVTYSKDDDTTKIYYFKDDRYFKSDTFDWKIIGGFDDFKNLIKNTDPD